MNRRLVVLVLAAIAALAGCGAGDPNEPAPSTPLSTRTIPPSTLSPATTLVSGLPRQVGTEGNFQVFEVTAHQRELVAQNAVKVLTRHGLWDQRVRFGITDPFKKQHFVLINPGYRGGAGGRRRRPRWRRPAGRQRSRRAVRPRPAWPASRRPGPYRGPGGLTQRMRPVGGSRPAYTWTCRPSRSGRCRITTDPPSCRSDSERMTAEQARQPA
jgi:hypothetical protein